MTDNTGNAGGTGKRTSAASIASQALSGTASREILGKKAPRFMSPTVSSTKQATQRSSKVNNTPPDPSVSSSKPGNWMSSAAKRVGFGRGADGTPRSKKGDPSKPPKGVVFPDKVCPTI